jgi:hypothetical protein
MNTITRTSAVFQGPNPIPITDLHLEVINASQTLVAILNEAGSRGVRLVVGSTSASFFESDAITPTVTMSQQLFTGSAQFTDIENAARLAATLG